MFIQKCHRYKLETDLITAFHTPIIFTPDPEGLSKNRSSENLVLWQ